MRNEGGGQGRWSGLGGVVHDRRRAARLTLAELAAKTELSQSFLSQLENGRTNLIEGFTSKRMTPFNAYLVLSKNRAKAEFEFPPR